MIVQSNLKRKYWVKNGRKMLRDKSESENVLLGKFLLVFTNNVTTVTDV